jgi:CO/xanthine dehydrogenase FAD-binding subunit
MRSQFQYFRPSTLHEALEFLQEEGPSTSVIAGGTDLMISVRNGLMASAYVMDISRLEELRTVTRTEETLVIGAAVTYTELMANREIIDHAPVLTLAARQVGSLQIRNVGTLGGNVANASPAADSVPALLVHSTWVRIQSAFEERFEPLENVIVGPYTTNLKPGELIIGFILEPLPDHRAEFQRIARRKALSVARINAASVGKVNTDEVVSDIRLSVGSITPRPCRMTAAENRLRGKVPNENLIQEAAAAVSGEMIRQSGIRHSTEYKRPAVEGLVVKTLSRLFQSHES